jgi:hypothetical protein
MLESIWLVHPDEAMCEAFRRRFARLRGVRVVQGRFEDLEPHDAFVTAGNAFGMMTAGIDAAVVRAFGDELMTHVQHRIMNDYYGEQPVGTAFVIVTENARIPFLVHAPTMRVPGNIEGTDKVYSATWAGCRSMRRRGRWRSRTDTTSNRRTASTGRSSQNGRRRSATTGRDK